MAKILIQNKQKSTILTLLVTLLLFSISIIPLIVYRFFYHTVIYNFLISHNYWIYISFILFFYFIYYGVYIYKIKFDNYSLLIQSGRTISSWFGSKVYNLELSNEMLIGFRFMGSFLSINDKLLIQMKSNGGRKCAVRIPLTLIGKNKKTKLKQRFNNIIQNNRCQTS